MDYTKIGMYTENIRLQVFRSGGIRKWSLIQIWNDDRAEFDRHRVETFRIDPEDPTIALIAFPYAGTDLVTAEHRVRLDLIFPAN